MIRARSPLFPLTYLLACVFGFGVGVWQFSADRLETLGLVFVVTSAPLLILIAVLEWRIYHGWEPFWLRRFYPEVRVVGTYRDEADLPGHQRVEMEFPDGRRQSFILDLEEVGLCSAGDLVHLWAIGKHVSHIVVIEPGKAPVGGVSFEESGDGCAQFFMWVFPLASSIVAGAGLGLLSSRAVGTLIGQAMIVGGSLTALILGVVWIRGWQVQRGAISDPASDTASEVGCCLLELLAHFPFWFW